jgi:DUF4097 and DUF4098 domain-containing protein YvlB
MRLSLSFVALTALACAATASAQPVVVRTRSYQGRDRGPEQTDRFSAKYKIGRDGRLSLANVSGDITVTGGSGDEAIVEAIKRTRGGRSSLDDVQIQADSGANRVDIRTEYPRMGRGNVSVDYTVTVPNGAAVELHSISGTIKVTGIRGVVRVETVSGGVSASGTPNVELAKSVSGDLSLSGISTDGNVTAGTVSGTVTAKGLKAKRLDLSSVSGDITLTDVTVTSVHAKSISGGFEYTGSIQKGGDYDVNLHSGTIRFTLTNPSGFYLNADTFSGSIRTDFPVTIGGSARDDRDRGSRRMRMGQSVRGNSGDGSATLTLRTFSGNIVIAKR